MSKTDWIAISICTVAPTDATFGLSRSDAKGVREYFIEGKEWRLISEFWDVEKQGVQRFHKYSTKECLAYAVLDAVWYFGIHDEEHHDKS